MSKWVCKRGPESECSQIACEYRDRYNTGTGPLPGMGLEEEGVGRNGLASRDSRRHDAE